MNKSNLNNIEKQVFDILKRIGCKIKIQHTIDKYSVDFLVNDKYIIECYGDYWHGNPNKYSPSYFHKGKKKTIKEIWERDAERKQLFKELGYEFLYLWESDIKTRPKIVKKKIKKFLE